VPDQTDQIIEEFLDGKPRARELARMIDALESRRAALVRERESTRDPARLRQWDARLREVDRQIAVLREELAITGFVEDSIRVAVNRPRPLPDEDGAL